MEDPLLFGMRQAGVQRQHVDAPLEPQAFEMPSGTMGNFADVALGRQKNQDVATAFAADVVDACDHVPSQIVLVVVVFGASVDVDPRQVACFDWIAAAFDGQDRSRLTFDRKMFGKPLRVDRCRRDDHAELGAALDDPVQVAEQEIDVQRPLVRFVDQDRIVGPQITIRLSLGQQDAVGHQLDERVGRGLVTKANFVCDAAVAAGSEFLG